MISKQYIWPLFILMILAQLAVPIYSIFSSEKIITKGTAYKFKARPVDPTDPFRGKYIRLNFEIEQKNYPSNSLKKLARGQTLYALLGISKEGYSELTNILDTSPKGDEVFLKVKCKFLFDDSLAIDLPFERFYMEETLAKPAEDLLRNPSIDNDDEVYASVNILNGNSVLMDVMVNDTSIVEYVRSRLE